jgi:hypothetical protein
MPLATVRINKLLPVLLYYINKLAKLDWIKNAKLEVTNQVGIFDSVK